MHLADASVIVHQGKIQKIIDIATHDVELIGTSLQLNLKFHSIYFPDVFVGEHQWLPAPPRQRKRRRGLVAHGASPTSVVAIKAKMRYGRI